MNELPDFVAPYRPEHVNEQLWRLQSLQMRNQLNGFVLKKGLAAPERRFSNGYSVLTQTLVGLFADQSPDFADAMMRGFLDCCELTSHTLRSSTKRDLWMQMAIQNGSMMDLHQQQSKGAVALGQWLIDNGHPPHLYCDNEDEDVLDYLLIYSTIDQSALIELIEQSTPQQWWLDKNEKYQWDEQMGINREHVVQRIRAKEIEVAVGDRGVTALARKM